MLTLQVVKDFTSAYANVAVGAEVLESLSPVQQIKIVDEELTITLGSSETGVK